MSKVWQITSSFPIDTGPSSVTLEMETGVLCVFPQIKYPKEQSMPAHSKQNKGIKTIEGKKVLGT